MDKEQMIENTETISQAQDFVNDLVEIYKTNKEQVAYLGALEAIKNDLKPEAELPVSLIILLLSNRIKKYE